MPAGNIDLFGPSAESTGSTLPPPGYGHHSSRLLGDSSWNRRPSGIVNAHDRKLLGPGLRFVGRLLFQKGNNGSGERGLFHELYPQIQLAQD